MFEFFILRTICGFVSLLVLSHNSYSTSSHYPTTGYNSFRRLRILTPDSLAQPGHCCSLIDRSAGRARMAHGTRARRVDCESASARRDRSGSSIPRAERASGSLGGRGCQCIGDAALAMLIPAGGAATCTATARLPPACGWAGGAKL